MLSRIALLAVVMPSLLFASAGDQQRDEQLPRFRAGANLVRVDAYVSKDDAAVMDLAYRPGLTPWIMSARAAGHRAADGLEMLIAQGAEAFERWFGQKPDRDAMRAALAA